MLISKNFFFKISLFCTLVLTYPNYTQKYLKTLPFKKRFFTSSSKYRPDLQKGEKLSEVETTSQSENGSCDQKLEDNNPKFTLPKDMVKRTRPVQRKKTMQNVYSYYEKAKNNHVKFKKSKIYTKVDDYNCNTESRKDDSTCKNKKNTELQSSGKKSKNCKSRNLKKKKLQSEDDESDPDFSFEISETDQYGRDYNFRKNAN